MTTIPNDLTHNGEHAMAKTKEHTQRKVSCAPLQKFLDESGWNATEFSEKTGFSKNTASYWLREGMIPEYVLVLIDGIRAKHFPKSKNRNAAILVSGNHDDVAMLSLTAERLGLKIAQVEI